MENMKIEQLAKEHADKVYDSESDRKSVIIESIEHSNRMYNFIEGYNANTVNTDLLEALVVARDLLNGNLDRENYRYDILPKDLINTAINKATK